MATFWTRGGLAMLLQGLIDFDGHTCKYALCDGTLITDKDTASFGYGDIGSNEASGPGYTAGGPTLASVTVTTDVGGISYVDANDMSLSSVTLSNVVGGYVWDDNPTTPKADPILIVHDFGATYGVSGGTLSLTVNNTTGLGKIAA